MALSLGVDGRVGPGAGDKEFYAEMLRIIREYLGEYGGPTPSKALQQLVRHASCRARVLAARLGEEQPPGTVDSGIVKECAQRGIVSETGGSKERHFTEEIRCIILGSLIRAPDRAGRTALLEHHLWVHLLELHFLADASLLEKVSRFLNTNFKLRDGDFVGHACRRNLGELVRIQPALAPAVEELVIILSGRSAGDVASSAARRTATPPDAEPQTEEDYQAALARWKASHQISDDFYNIVSGRYTGFACPMEACCYDLAYRNHTGHSNEYLDVLNGRFDGLAEGSGGWLRLVVLLVSGRAVCLKELETLFETLFHETLELDYLTALGFLSHSRAVEYHFNALLCRIPLKGLTVESLVSFAANVGISPSPVVQRYASRLQDEHRYDELCRCIAGYSAPGFNYTRDALLYFIKNFKRYEAFVEDAFLQDSTNKFIFWMHRISEAEHKTLMFLMEHECAGWVLADIVGRVLDYSPADDTLLVAALNCVVNAGANEALLADLRLKVLRRMVRRLECLD